jgi:hypothetical protein
MSNKQSGPRWIAKLRRQAQKASPDQLPANVYSTIEKTPLDRFITCIVDQDLTALIIEGEADEATLAIAWSFLFLDYLDASKEVKARYEFELVRDLSILRARVAIVDTILALFQTVFVEEAVKELNRLEIFVSLDPSNPESYREGLEEIRTRGAEFVIDANLKQIELEELEKAKKDEPAQKIDRQYFVNILGRIATFRRVAVIRTSELVVAEFIAAFNEFLDHLNQGKPAQG